MEDLFKDFYTADNANNLSYKNYKEIEEINIKLTIQKLEENIKKAVLKGLYYTTSPIYFNDIKQEKILKHELEKLGYIMMIYYISGQDYRIIEICWSKGIINEI